MSKKRLRTAHIRFSPSILSRLGEELNIGYDQGILELVKNAYDANAYNCLVEIIDNDAGTIIRVTDDGDGMTPDQLYNGWLLLGESQKDPTKRTRLNRVPAGNKGLGRLAALRMGTVAQLTTTYFEDPMVTYEVSIDWDQFVDVDSVDDVPIDIYAELNLAGRGTGSVIEIINLRNRLGRMDVKRLARGMLMLGDPFSDTPGSFQPKLKAAAFADLERLVEQRYFENSEFHLKARIDEAGYGSANVYDHRGGLLFGADHDSLRLKRKNQNYSVHGVEFDLWVFILNTETFATRPVAMGEVRNWLQEFGGVYLYMNGIRVAPYGNNGDDWLSLNLARVRNPEVRPSTNSSIGRIAINHVDSRFQQKTDRTGLIENDAFNEVVEFAQEALNFMARERLREAELRREQTRKNNSEEIVIQKKNLKQAISKLKQNEQEVISTIVKSYDSAWEKEANSLRGEVQLYRTLSTVGVVAAVFAHETKHPVSLIERRAKTILRRIKKGEVEDKERLSNPAKQIIKQSKQISSFQDLMLGFVEKDKRRNTRVDVYKTISNVLTKFKPLFDERDVRVSADSLEGNPFIRGSEASIESIITNLLVNSIKAFTDVEIGIRIINITAEISGNEVRVIVSDNGPGIEAIDVKDIWTPGQTGYSDGTGLGLTIVRDSIRDLGGTAEAKAHGRDGGAEFILTIPTLKN
ncbi:sensor histidine kinase [Hymenobacter siberiensis]|uniref:sensor histidine kinase n=1 Tax=Hymenobacter siberiensis TaxID=2848396 RepID=UPI001C1E403C|nr:sensor histidine kinase [Hymenobacter siberiensis]